MPLSCCHDVCSLAVPKTKRIRKAEQNGGANADPDAQGCNHPTWSPDGTQIAFIRSHNNIDDGEVYTVNLNGPGLTQVTPRPRCGQPRLGHPPTDHRVDRPTRASLRGRLSNEPPAD